MEKRNIIEWSEYSEYRELTIPSGEILEVVMLLAFRLNSYQARAVRREPVECISRNHKPFEVILTATTGIAN